MTETDMKIVDTGCAEPTTELERALKEHDAENMRRATEKEQRLLAYKGLTGRIIDAVFDLKHRLQR